MTKARRPRRLTISYKVLTPQHSKAANPKPDGNRVERRAWDAMRREAERTNETYNGLGLILSGKSTMAKQDKRT